MSRMDMVEDMSQRLAEEAMNQVEDVKIAVDEVRSKIATTWSLSVLSCRRLRHSGGVANNTEDKRGAAKGRSSAQEGGSSSISIRNGCCLSLDLGTEGPAAASGISCEGEGDGTRGKGARGGD